MKFKAVFGRMCEKKTQILIFFYLLTWYHMSNQVQCHVDSQRPPYVN